jgi:hypothetical protein
MENYNLLRLTWNQDILHSGSMKQIGGRLWFAGCEHPNGGLEEFNENCQNSIKDFAHSSPRSDHDHLFTYNLDDVDRLSERLGIPWEPSKDQPFTLSTIYIGFKWNLDSRIVSLAPNKIRKYRDAINDWLNRLMHVLKDVQTLYSKLLHASAALPKGRTYLTSLECMLRVCTDKPFMPHHPIRAVMNNLKW